MFNTTSLHSCFSNISPALAASLASLHAFPYTIHVQQSSTLESKHCCMSTQHGSDSLRKRHCRNGNNGDSGKGISPSTFHSHLFSISATYIPSNAVTVPNAKTGLSWPSAFMTTPSGCAHTISDCSSVAKFRILCNSKDFC